MIIAGNPSGATAQAAGKRSKALLNIIGGSRGGGQEGLGGGSGHDEIELTDERDAWCGASPGRGGRALCYVNTPAVYRALHVCVCVSGIETHHMAFAGVPKAIIQERLSRTNLH